MPRRQFSSVPVVSVVVIISDYLEFLIRCSALSVNSFSVMASSRAPIESYVAVVPAPTLGPDTYVNERSVTVSPHMIGVPLGMLGLNE